MEKRQKKQLKTILYLKQPSPYTENVCGHMLLRGCPEDDDDAIWCVPFSSRV